MISQMLQLYGMLTYIWVILRKMLIHIPYVEHMGNGKWPSRNAVSFFIRRMVMFISKLSVITRG